MKKLIGSFLLCSFEYRFSVSDAKIPAHRINIRMDLKNKDKDRSVQKIDSWGGRNSFFILPGWSFCSKGSDVP